MAKITLNDITTEFRGQAQLNNNFTAIENEFQNKVLYRNNPTGEPNSMQVDLDMNSNRILNLPVPSYPNDPVRLQDLTNGDSIVGLAYEDSIADLRNRSLTNVPANSLVFVSGYHSPGDGGEGYFRAYSGSLTYTENYGTVILAGGTAGAVSTYAWLRVTDTINPKHFGAKGDGVTDDYSAIQAAINSVQPWGSYDQPDGTYLVSQKLLVVNKYRTKWHFGGVMSPYGSYNDYLISFDNSANDSIVPSMAMQLSLENLTIDGLWKSRGAEFKKLYDSALDHVQIWRPWGTGISIPMCQEIVMYQPMIISGKARVDSTIASAADWDSGTSYSTSVVVKMNYSAWSGASTYSYASSTSMLAVRNSNLYRSIQPINFNIDPEGATSSSSTGTYLSTDYWERIPFEYYVSSGITGNVNKSPHDTTTNYTTRSGVTADKYWRQVWPDEPAFSIVGIADANTIDNCKIINFISRTNEHATLIRIDNTMDNVRPLKTEFYAAQVHGITTAYINAFNSATANTTAFGGSISYSAAHLPILMHVPSSSGLKFIGGQIQMGNLNRCKALMAGTLGIGGNAARTFLIGTHIEGTSASGQVAISILPSVETFGDNWIEQGLGVALRGASAIKRIDLHGETETAQSGTLVLPTGTNSYAITFSPPMQIAPQLSIYPKKDLHGLTWKVSSLTKNGFTVTLSGRYLSPAQSWSLNSTSASQTATYSHNFSYTASGVIFAAPTANPGAGYHLYMSTNGANGITVTAPSAPTQTLTQNWNAYWENLYPEAGGIQFDWYATVEPE